MDKNRNYKAGSTDKCSNPAAVPTDKNSDPAAEFLEDAADQIAYKPLRPAVIQELKDHIEDRAEEFESEGMSPEEARRKAVGAMGDAVEIGTGINAIRCVRSSRLLFLLTFFLMLSGLAAAAYMYWNPEQMANGFHYYLPGAAALLFTSWKGYPWLIRRQRLLLTVLCSLLLLEALPSLFLRLSQSEAFSDYLKLPDHMFYFPWHMAGYYSVLMMAPLLAFLLYRMRRRGQKAVLAAVFAACAAVLFYFYVDDYFVLSALAVFLFSALGTLWFMILRGVLTGPKNRLCITAAAGCAAVIGIFCALPSQASYLREFAAPDREAYEMWDDSYNGVLMKELLSRAPLAGPISLTPEEMMYYGTGEWYFGEEGKGVLDSEYEGWSGDGPLPYIIRYDASNVTLWDILPQHYHNNYLIAILILNYGWLPGIVFLAAIAAFYFALFTCIFRTRGALAGSLAFCCGLSLLSQTLLYVLGNFGFQYAAFTNLPLISEGSLSILVNMLLLGFVFSAYRYDRVIDPPDSIRCGQCGKCGL